MAVGDGGGAGRTDGGVGSSATTKAAHDFFMHLCDKLVAELDKLGPAIKAFVDHFIDHYGGGWLPGPVKDWIEDKVNWVIDKINNELWPKIRDGLQKLCRTISTDVLPWIVSPATLREVAGKWQDQATHGKKLAGRLSSEKIDAIGYPVSEWEGGGSDQYAKTIERQHEFAVGVAGVSDQMGTTLTSTASDLEDAALGLTIMAAGIVGAVAGIIGAIATAETGVGAIIGLVCAIISALIAVVGALIGGIEAVKTMLVGAGDRIEELRDSLEALVAQNGGSWPKPNAVVGGHGGMPGKPEWDDGVG